MGVILRTFLNRWIGVDGKYVTEKLERLPISITRHFLVFEGRLEFAKLTV